MRLSKFLAHAGYCSRREAEKIIKDDKVIINNVICNDFSYQVDEKDEVYIGNTHVVGQSEIELYILNKPKGYITSRKDELDRKTVYDLLPDNKQHLISVGRLDYNTEGLLLFTNNGDYARYYELPKNKISRTYKVKVYGNIQNSYIKKIKDGITIDGITHNVDEITLEKKLNTNNWFIMKLTEGKNREIRKIFESLNLVVNRIIRTHYGKYSIVNMKLGEFKEVNAEKIKA
ncbi:rRNA pseudouridine synthase [Gammaproteobacteria bacterium]|nr:rRNA pseudouridine synthase [Gammaproteobacteria bacterium]|tara:strand:- start:1203 stop:1895 length:693 start_codon:yes stop_codon:yes gene_type:complete